MSQENQTITLKIHHGDEIRPIHLAQLNWSELITLLSSNYPVPYTLKYRDNDNDMVTMVAQQDLQDALDMSEDGIIHLYIIDKTSIPIPIPNNDEIKSNDDDIASQLSHEEISTLLSECLSDPIIINAIPPFLTTFIDQLTINMSTSTPLSTSWSQSLQQHPTIRDHVILSVLLPRLSTSLAKADDNHMATRIPSHILPMIKGFLPMLPMFLPNIIPMITNFMSQSTTSDTQTPTNPFANSPLMSMLGPMLSGMQPPTQSASAPTTAAAPVSTAYPINTNSSAAQTQAQPQANPLLGLLGPLLAANAANTANQANPFASMFQQFAQPPSETNTNINANTNINPDYTQQLAQLESMELGSRALNLSLLQQWNGDVERVMEFLSTME